MRFKHWPAFYLSVAVFLVFLAAGTMLSRKKFLWNDELFTQRAVIDAHSYGDILVSHTPDGNKNPFFYLVQKGVCDLFGFHLPAAFAHTLDIARVRDIRSQLIMRLPSNVYTSLSLALIFYFFTRFYSVYAALYALSAALVSPLVWMYWVEARPYSLWLLFTTIQLLLLCCLWKSPQTKIIKPLVLTHLLLALTISASIFQISVAVVVLWWKVKPGKKELVSLWMVPMGMALSYIFLFPAFKTKTYFFFQNLFDAVMPEHLVVYALYALTAWLLQRKYKTQESNIFFLPVFVLFLASGAFMLFVDLFTKNDQFGFFSRYLIFLTPADVLMLTFVSIDLRRWSRPYPWVCMNVSIALAGMVAVRGLVTYRALLAAATYLHSPGS